MAKHIDIIGLGAGDLDQLPLGIYKKLTQAPSIIARTLSHPVIEALKKEGLAFSSFDYVYEAHDRFEDVYEEIAGTLIKQAEEGPVMYAVPGHPLVAEQTVQILLEYQRKGIVTVTVHGGQSFLDDLFTAVEIDPIEGFQLLDGTALERDGLQVTQHIIIGQVYDAFIASEVKLTLMEKYPDEHPVTIVTAAGSSGQQMTTVPLYELDHGMALSNLTSVYVPPLKEDQLNGEFFKLRQIIAALRSPTGCPWDREQTHESLKKHLIEEAYELLEAIDQKDYDHITEELGDVLLQVMLHAQIGEDDGYFTIQDVISTLSEKMIRRHPHVFGDVKAETTEDVMKNWKAIKQKEKGDTKEYTSFLKDTGAGKPALIQAAEIQKAAAKAGFDWEDHSGAWDKFEEEWQEFQEEVANGNKEASLKEFGDVLFALVNVSRFHDIHAEEALIMTNQKFKARFMHVEKCVQASGKPFNAHTLQELDQFWDEAKRKGL
ncbi:nucleoside triphosphate pyrophosphohydrolase [Jeotgalibacillus proteolyticus]|uniref:Nucleoside triphosphate pyrophosphohydrolase n=1 Tax=Jeotgalibacillus proteolyticus TaxID=2082395 RepID=A0A2S5G6D6_9BACL|nr:nucleoside triphosphate pyrophosphohydrolase [Jeotgalibacillus proteolyticus]PPA68542.1 nucleoside triphosphate pyrophosphohydrolase [Jeotgalibacillus proteolyticus]